MIFQLELCTETLHQISLHKCFPTKLYTMSILMTLMQPYQRQAGPSLEDPLTHHAVQLMFATFDEMRWIYWYTSQRTHY